MSKFVRCSSFQVLTSRDTRALLTNIKLILWNSIFALFIASLCFKYWGDVFTCVNIFHNRLKRVTKYKSSIWEMLRVESDFRANTHYHLSLQECATIKCDHHGIWEGGSGSLCIAPGTGKSGVRQEDPPFQKKYWCTAMQCKSAEYSNCTIQAKYLNDLWHVEQNALFVRYQDSAEYSSPLTLGGVK